MVIWMSPGLLLLELLSFEDWNAPGSTGPVVRVYSGLNAFLYPIFTVLVFFCLFLLKLTRVNLPNPFLFLKPILKFQRYLLKRLCVGFSLPVKGQFQMFSIKFILFYSGLWAHEAIALHFSVIMGDFSSIIIFLQWPLSPPRSPNRTFTFLTESSSQL